MTTLDITVHTNFKTTTCYHCGTLFAMTADFYDNRTTDHGNFYCPSGHAQRFVGKTEAEVLREQLAGAQAEANRQGQRAKSLREQRDAKERQNSALRGVITKTKKRVGKGTCPCCNRHFENVHRHMSTQHPTYAGGPGDTP